MEVKRATRSRTTKTTETNERPWLWNLEPFTSEMIPEGCVGFVYLIISTETGRKYIGKKNFFSNRRVVRKTGRKVRRVIKESNWKTYFGSSDQFDAVVREEGRENFDRHILHLCRTKKAMGYYEVAEQVKRDVLKDEKFCNGNILGRYFRQDAYGVVDSNDRI